MVVIQQIDPNNPLLVHPSKHPNLFCSVEILLYLIHAIACTAERITKVGNVCCTLGNISDQGVNLKKQPPPSFQYTQCIVCVGYGLF